MLFRSRYIPRGIYHGISHGIYLFCMVYTMVYIMIYTICYIPYGTYHWSYGIYQLKVVYTMTQPSRCHGHNDCMQYKYAIYAFLSKICQDLRADLAIKQRIDVSSSLDRDFRVESLKHRPNNISPRVVKPPTIQWLCLLEKVSAGRLPLWQCGCNK